MVSKTVYLQGEEAAQMKTIAVLIQKASEYQASIHVQSGARKANAKSLLGLMSLGLLPGSEIHISAEGADAEAAVAALSEWLGQPEA